MFKKKGLILLFIFIFSLLLSCNKKDNNQHPKVNEVTFDNNIDLYDIKAKSSSNILMNIQQLSTFNYTDHLLEIDYKVQFKNMSNSDVILNVSNPKVYGNGDILSDKVYEDFDYENKASAKLFSSKSFNIKIEEDAYLSYSLVVKDGNDDAIITTSFDLNNVILNVYNHEESYKLDHFTYVHNPLYSASVLADAEYDENAYYGFKPNSTGSLSSYAKYDWTIEKDVLEYKEARIKYIEENDKKIKDLELELRAQNKTIEEIARACSSLRNQVRLDQYKNDPEGLATLKERNLSKYGHEEGPLPDELFVKYGSWEAVLKKCYSTNMGMDACCGVYDKYFYMYE